MFCNENTKKGPKVSFSTPTKNKPKIKQKKINLDDFNLCTIRNESEMK